MVMIFLTGVKCVDVQSSVSRFRALGLSLKSGTPSLSFSYCVEDKTLRQALTTFSQPVKYGTLYHLVIVKNLKY